MAAMPYLLCYVAFSVFAIAVVARIVLWSRLPMHVRWELYPIPRGLSEKACCGGSFMEQSDWWTKPRRRSTWGQLKTVLVELVFLAAVRQHNRALWIRTFPFHFGLCLAGASAGLALSSGALQAWFPGLVSARTGEALRTVVAAVGVMGLTLGTVGALALLQRRLAVAALRNATRPADLFNLVFFVLAFGSGLATFAWVDPDARKAVAFAANLTSFNMVALPGSGIEAVLPLVTVTLLSALIAYIPLTHMSHFVSKYFAYHAIRWNDQPNLPGGPDEVVVKDLLGQKVTWAAEHIRGGGTKTWSDVALENPARSEP
ncbi:MAG: respiratory nitrate reductase subunit gamma [Polyangiaceae bacterium]|nr:respiratory nitrate reductase subunit gamma [Polyangiaceae bacterium]